MSKHKPHIKFLTTCIRLFHPKPLALLCCGLAIVSVSSTAEIIGYDMNNTTPTTSYNLTEFTNDFTDSFSSSNDGFQKYTFNSADLNALPDGLVDLTSYGRLDNQGLIFDDGYQAFGIVDSVNSSNPFSMSVASWSFNTENVSNLSVSAKFAAMGDFEANDHYFMTASFGGDDSELIFDIKAQTSLAQNYTLADGSARFLDDPLGIEAGSSGFTFNLDNTFTEYSASINGQGDLLTLSMFAIADGGTEAFALSDLIISGEFGQTAPVENPPIDNGGGWGSPPGYGAVDVNEPTGLLLFAAPLIGLLLRRRNQFLS